LYLALFFDAQNQGMLRRVQIQADDGFQLVGKVRIMAYLEGLDQERIESVCVPDAPHAGLAGTNFSRHGARGPVARAGWSGLDRRKSKEPQAMNLYILHHASAGVRRADPVIDAKRSLDKQGKEQCLLIARYLNALRLQFDLIASSPLNRSVQTVSLVGTEVAYDNKIQITDSVSPSGTVDGFQSFVGSLLNYENVLVVGHNPNLPEFLGSLICAPRAASIRMRKGAIARVDCTRRPAQLISLVEPRILRLIYASAAKISRRNTAKK
jgi:phosphohistidine phosphatase